VVCIVFPESRPSLVTWLRLLLNLLRDFVGHNDQERNHHFPTPWLQNGGSLYYKQSMVLSPIRTMQPNHQSTGTSICHGKQFNFN